MTVLLVLFTFATFLLIDHYRTGRALVKPEWQMEAKPDAMPRLKPAMVGGFEVPGTCVTTRVTPGH